MPTQTPVTIPADLIPILDALADHEARIAALEGSPPPPPQEPTASLAGPATVNVGEPYELTIATTDAVSATLDGSPCTLNGTVTKTAPATAGSTTHTLTATGQAGTTPATASLSVTFQETPPPPGGTLVVESGQTVVLEAPYDYDAVITELGSTLILNPGCDLQILTVLDCMGAYITNGTPKTEYVRCGELPAGTTAITLSTTPTGWQPGDKVKFPDTRQRQNTSNYVSETETRTIETIVGNLLTINAPLTYAHLGGRTKAGVLDCFPVVANMSRDIVVRSRDPLNRAHIKFHGPATIDARYAYYPDLGRTTTSPSSPIGEYHFHAHELGTNAVNIVGNVIDGNTLTHRWGIVLHGTQGAVVRRNIVCNVGGAGIVCEDGTEFGNWIEENLIFDVRGEGGRADTAYPGREGTGIWLRSGMQHTNRNIVMSCPVAAGITIFNGPMAPGLLEFDGNEVASCKNGFTAWFLDADYQNYSPALATENVVNNLTLWSIIELGYFHYPCNRLVFDGLKIRSYGGPDTRGLHFMDYLAARCVVKNADIQGCQVGIVAPGKVGDTVIEGQTEMPFTIEDSYFACNVNISIPTPWSVQGGGSGLPPRRVTLSNCEHHASSEYFIGLDWNPGASGANTTVADACEVIDHDGLIGDDFGVYWTQKPSPPCTVTRPKIIGYCC